MAGRAKIRVPLTEAAMKRLLPRPQRYLVWDENLPGFCVEVFPTGRRTFKLKLRSAERGVLTRTIGTWPAMTVEKARRQARVVLGLLAQGQDPRAEKRSPEKRPLQLLFEEWLQHAQSRLRPTTLREVVRIWEVYLGPRVGKRSLNALTPQTVTNLLQNVAQAHGPVMANRCRSWLSAMVNFARKLYGLDISNPVALAPRFRETPRTRFLTAEQAARLYGWCLANPYTGDPLAMLLLLGVRAGTLAAGAYEQVDWETQTWEIPPHAMKGGRPHALPLPRQVLEILERRKGTALPWPKPSRAALERAKAELGLPWLRQHDLRRSCASLLTGLGAPTVVVARLLGHTLPPGLAVTAGIYALPSIDTLRAWLQRLGDFLESQAMTEAETLDGTSVRSEKRPATR